MINRSNSHFHYFLQKEINFEKKYGFTSTQPGFDFPYIKAVALELLFILFLFTFFFLARPRAFFHPPNFFFNPEKMKTSRAEFRVGNWTVPTLMYIRSPSAFQHGNSRSKANKKTCQIERSCIIFASWEIFQKVLKISCRWSTPMLFDGLNSWKSDFVG